jgi:hypothetical protein
MIDPKERTVTFEASFTFKHAVDYVGWLVLTAIGYGITWWFENIDLLAVLLIPFLAAVMVASAHIEVEWTTVEEMEG